MRFIAIHKYSEMTGIGSIGVGPDMVLGARPRTDPGPSQKKRKRRKKYHKVEGIASAFKKLRNTR